MSSSVQKHWVINHKVGLMLEKLCEHLPNIELALRQHVGYFYLQRYPTHSADTYIYFLKSKTC